MISVFDLFSIGVGPSSSHTVGPMRAARAFAQGLDADGVLSPAARVRVELFGSLGATGLGHGSDRAVVLGLLGEYPETVDTATASERASAIRATGRIALLGRHEVVLGAGDLVLHRRESLPHHPNGMRFSAFDSTGRTLRERIYYSVGGGFVLDEQGAPVGRDAEDPAPPQYPFSSGAELLARCDESGLPISGVMLANEQARRTADEVRSGLREIWAVMRQCVRNGWTNEGALPGRLRVPRRAPGLYRRLRAEPDAGDPLLVMDWVNLFALAVNEENAAGGRVVTAPTNGAAGVLPAVLHYYARFCPGATDDQIVRFLLCAGAIGVLYKENASISGAEVGCQGEVGSACSMAAGALCEVLGGTPRQVENAAEIGMEHNLGLTCDPVGGLVQIPCIERNAVAAVKAVNAARIALRGNGTHIVSLDRVIKTMRDTGADMLLEYKETSRGGLAVNVIEC
ncbi:L-serine dehydratase [Actinomadura madurae]|uniref:L-serine dehydratase n=1 Tax=Actinomadura madurae TaxID=1993 RepID=A0A1I5UET3_9ACTN|nr:L-serine ammonia-lyase [Actinomadura madurae]SFP93719.1 L-serine dehydratase [Actinomadura madurae]